MAERPFDIPSAISVTGEAQISVPPDRAQIDAGVTSDAKAAREASDANTAAMGKVLAALKGAGIDPAKISTVLISHFHPDHIFGLMEKGTNAANYPNAELVVSATEYKWWTEPGRV